MFGIIAKKEGVDYQSLNLDSSLSLLADMNDVEVMLQTIKQDDLVWLAPSGEPNTMEFCYIFDGSLTLESDNEKMSLNKGDSFRFDALEKPIALKCREMLRMLYVSTKPLYTNADSLECELELLMNIIDEKDSYTKQHCQNVLDYSVAVCRELKCSDDFMDRLGIAALFHDVGKCYVPDEVLNKYGKLTNEEMKHIYKHPLNSKRLVEKRFGKEIATIVYTHHERLDGSGYPQGLDASEISLEARIVAVCDSFDAMTTQRTYNIQKTYDQAIRELEELNDKYDQRVVAALKRLVHNGTLNF